ncbi:hypothetical protein SALBM311S_01037 [Streptomyces alboniger]
MALLDGALLGLALAARPEDFPAAVKEYEREMFERTSAAARMSAGHAEVADVAGRQQEDARVLPTWLNATEYDRATGRPASRGSRP